MVGSMGIVGCCLLSCGGAPVLWQHGAVWLGREEDRTTGLSDELSVDNRTFSDVARRCIHQSLQGVFSCLFVSRLPSRWCSRSLRSIKDLDDDKRCATSPADEAGRFWWCQLTIGFVWLFHGGIQ